MSTDDKRIREFAYQIWESEGKPEGQESRHWEMARKLAEAEALAPKKPAKAPASKPAVSKTANGKEAKAKSPRPSPRPNRLRHRPLSRQGKKPPRKSHAPHENRLRSDCFAIALNDCVASTARHKRCVRHVKTVGASLLAIAMSQATLMSTDAPPSPAGLLLQVLYPFSPLQEHL